MRLKAGVIGLGGMGRTHLKTLRGIPDVDVVAVCDIEPKRLEDLDKAVAINVDTGVAGPAGAPAVRKHRDYRRMLKDERLDLVAICTPTHLHAEMIIAALKAGLHVFCEKPIALTGRQADRVVRAAARADRALLIGHVLRFWPDYVAIKKIINSGRHGRVLSAVFRRIGGTPGWGVDNWFLQPRQSGGVPLDLHIHDVDTIQWFFGPPEAVRARGVTGVNGCLTHVVADFRWAGSRGRPMVLAEAAWLDRPYPFFATLTVRLESATVEFEPHRTPTLTVYRGRANRKVHPPLPAEGSYKGEVEYFVKCLQAGRPCDRVPLAEAAADVRIVEAEMRSIRTGRFVRVPP